LFAPTLILNGSYWGQCDVIYTTGLMACLYYLCRQQENFALIAFGIAVSFKQQALFLLPLLVILTFKKYLSPMAFCWIPTVYLLAIFPALLLGRPLPDLLLIYFNQANTFKKLTLNAPNLYQWIPNDYYLLVTPIGMILAIAVLIMFIIFVGQSRAKINSDLIILLATLSVLLMPYFLPKMHDRYFFPADLISLIYGFYFPQYFFVPVAITLVSLFSYFPFLLGVEVIPLRILSLVLVSVIGFLVYHLKIALTPTFRP
jgi:Gpi18-like mannosyltransferase